MLKKIIRTGAILGAVVVLGAAALSAGGVDAARGSGGGGGKHGGGQTTGGTGTITLNQTDPHLGDSVTFTTTGGSSIHMLCYQASIFDTVFTAAQPVGSSFLLGGTSSVWLSRGGPAQCQATLVNSSGTGLAISNFTAGGAR
jgi:hypothetical protein